jgi:hypothetical protein
MYSMVQRRKKEKDSRYIQKASAPVEVTMYQICNISPSQVSLLYMFQMYLILQLRYMVLLQGSMTPVYITSLSPSLRSHYYEIHLHCSPQLSYHYRLWSLWALLSISMDTLHGCSTILSRYRTLTLCRIRLHCRCKLLLQVFCCEDFEWQ